jgi:hypothetical protein
MTRSDHLLCALLTVVSLGVLASAASVRCDSRCGSHYVSFTLQCKLGERAVNIEYDSRPSE